VDLKAAFNIDTRGKMIAPDGNQTPFVYYVVFFMKAEVKEDGCEKYERAQAQDVEWLLLLLRIREMLGSNLGL
jgi:hypothetical protein